MPAADVSAPACWISPTCLLIDIGSLLAPGYTDERGDIFPDAGGTRVRLLPCSNSPKGGDQLWPEVRCSIGNKLLDPPRNHHPVPRHGVASGEVITHCKPRHRQPLARKAAPTGVPGVPAPDREDHPREAGLNLIVDNTCTHKHGKVRAWLARRRPASTSTTRPPTPPGCRRSRQEA